MSKVWFVHEFDDRYNPPMDNGYWEVKWHDEDEKPQIGERCRVVNAVGGWHEHTIAECDEILFSTWHDVEYAYYTTNQQADYGWIDKEGNFYGCSYMGHADCAAACFDLSELEAEQAGYVKIYRDRVMAEYYPERFRPDGLGWYCSHPLTYAQKAKLTERGFGYGAND